MQSSTSLRAILRITRTVEVVKLLKMLGNNGQLPCKDCSVPFHFSSLFQFPKAVFPRKYRLLLIYCSAENGAGSIKILCSTSSLSTKFSTSSYTNLGTFLGTHMYHSFLVPLLLFLSIRQVSVHHTVIAVHHHLTIPNCLIAKHTPPTIRTKCRLRFRRGSLRWRFKR